MKIELQAHRGLEAEYPCNTMASFKAAIERGYPRIELDPALTKDGVIVVLHDKTINYTARRSDGSKIENPMRINDITYAEADSYDYGLWRGERFRGERLPLLYDVFRLCAANNVMIKVDNKLFGFPEKDVLRVFDMINETGVRTCISCYDAGSAIRAAEKVPSCHVSLDGITDEATLSAVSSAVGKDRFEIWLPVEYHVASWAPKEWFADKEKCERVKKYALLALWAIGSVSAFEKAVASYAPFAVETDGTVACAK